MQVSKLNNHQGSPYFYEIVEVCGFEEHFNGEKETAELVKLRNDLLTCAWSEKQVVWRLSTLGNFSRSLASHPLHNAVVVPCKDIFRLCPITVLSMSRWFMT